MSYRLGRLQQKLLTALHLHGGEVDLHRLTALAAGLIPDLASRPPYGRAPARSVYSSVARAVATLRRRGLVDTMMTGTARGRLEWLKDAGGRVRPVWKFRHPGRRLLVRSC